MRTRPALTLSPSHPPATARLALGFLQLMTSFRSLTQSSRGFAVCLLANTGRAAVSERASWSDATSRGSRNLSSGWGDDCCRNNHELCSKPPVHKGAGQLAVSVSATRGRSPNVVDCSSLVSCRPCTANSGRVYSSALVERGPLAQLVEQLTLNQRVGGSSPSRPTARN